MSEGNGEPVTGDGLGLQAVGRAGEVLGACPLKRTEIEAEITGTMARVMVTQRFHNPFPDTMEAVYAFPLHQDSAVDEMTLVTGDSVVKGVIRKREEAEKIYQDAKRAGQVAALLNQERPNIFNQHVANIRPGEDVVITIGYSQMMAWEDGRYRFEVPTVVGPRYIPGGGSEPVMREANPERGPNGEVPVVNPDSVSPTPQVPDADKITPPVAELGFRAGHDLSLRVRIDAGLPILDLKSELHGIVVGHPDGDSTRAVVRLKEGATRPDRDFVLSYATGGEGITDAVLTHTDERGKFFALVLEPPDRVEAQDILPRELVFVLDVSGSMSGFPIETSKALVRHAIESMRESDRFNVITFAGHAAELSSGFLANTEQNRHKALQFVERQHGSGGTEMMKGIEAALGRPPEAGKVRMVCFLTDGFIGNDSQIIGAVKKHAGSARVFCFGIGSSVNRYLLDAMSVAGRGKADYVLAPWDADAAAERFLRRIDAPVLTDIGIDFGGLGVVDVYPERVEDLFASEPIVVRGRYGDAQEGVIRWKGRNAAGVYQREVRVVFPEEDPANQVLASQWARAKVGKLAMDECYTGEADPKRVAEIIGLGIGYRLMTRYTSFVAVEEKRVEKNGELRTILVPLEMPRGLSHEGVFGAVGGNGAGWGSVSHGSGGGFSGIPMVLTKRCSSADRLERVRTGGGTVDCDAAVARSLDWLTSRQNKDGSWGDAHRCAATGLALLAYQGRCETPTSVKHGEAVTKAIAYLIQQGMKGKGVFTMFPDTEVGRYEHAIAVAALAEAYTFCRGENIHIPDLDVTVKRAAEQLMKTVSATKEVRRDPLLTGIHLYALKACKQTTLIPDREMAQCVDGAFRRMDAWKMDGLAKLSPLQAGAVGMAYVQWNEGENKVPGALRNQVARDFQFRWGDPQADLPALYFNAYFLFPGGGEKWEKLNAVIQKELLAAQQADGSFAPLGTAGGDDISGLLKGEGTEAVHLRTCLAALTLEVYYRYFSR